MPIASCRKDLNRSGPTYHVLVGDYFEKEHEHCDQVQKISDELEDVHYVFT